MSRGRSAITRVEVAIGVVAIAIVATISVQYLAAASLRGKVARVKSDMELLAKAIDAYTVDYNQPPIAPLNYPWESFDVAVNKHVTNDIALFTPLTTPVGYIASLKFNNPFNYYDNWNSGAPMPPRDFLFINFTTGVNAINSLTWCGESKPADLNWFYMGAGSHVAITSTPVMYCFNGDTAHKFAATWSLTSLGPSKESRDSASGGGIITFPRAIWVEPQYTFYTSGKVCTYDPSNGSQSLGHLWRFSSGGMK